MKNKSGILAVILLVGILSTMAYALNQVFATHVEQPIQFNHKLHVDPEGEIGMACSDCHLYYKTQHNSGRPVLSVCTDCHQVEETDKPELKKLMGYIEKASEVPWERIYYLPDHVAFSHRIHTQAAEIKCEVCHGNMAERTAPPSRPLVAHTMSFCMDCHRERQASLDCLACHK